MKRKKKAENNVIKFTAGFKISKPATIEEWNIAANQRKQNAFGNGPPTNPGNALLSGD